MVAEFQNPALQQFVTAIGDGLIFAQILIRRTEPGFELRHENDRTHSPDDLSLINVVQLRAMVDFTIGRAFRPLKSAPSLRAGWRLNCTTEADLYFALNVIYPGAVADWYAHHFHTATPVHFREFTSRQTGMYRITAMLTDAQAAPVIRACCHRKFCLKQRLWTVGGLEADRREEKSLIPCFEPCAVLLEFARKAMRLEQAAERGETALETAENKNDQIREADFENPHNPRRVQWRIEKAK